MNVVIIYLSSIFRLSMKVAVTLSGYSARPAKPPSFVRRRTDIMRGSVKRERSTVNTAKWPSALKTSRWEIKIVQWKDGCLFINVHKIIFSCSLTVYFRPMMRSVWSFLYNARTVARRRSQEKRLERLITFNINSCVEWSGFKGPIL